MKNKNITIKVWIKIFMSRQEFSFEFDKENWLELNETEKDEKVWKEIQKQNKMRWGYIVI